MGYTGATEEQFQRWEELIRGGHSPYQAARDVGTTLSALKRGDLVRHDQMRELSKEIRAGVVDKRMDELALKEEPNAAIVNTWAKANHPEAYAEKSKLEITGTIEHEHRGVFAIGDLVRTAVETGVLQQVGDARPQGALPAAGEVPAGRAGDALDPPGDLPAA